MFKLVMPGRAAQSIPCYLDSRGTAHTVGSGIAAGGGSVEAGMTATVNGRRVAANTPVKEGDTVALQPMNEHG